MALQIVIEYDAECYAWAGGPDGEYFEPWYLTLYCNGWKVDMPIEDLNLWSFLSLIEEVLHDALFCA